ncbi:MAG: T9SS type A sorting domain-containing protein [Flavobacterium sp.]|nr:T9SS type A sorting domain-containing protein [Flavobacterium sp.]
MKKRVLYLIMCVFAFTAVSAQINSVAIVGAGIEADGWPGQANNPGPEDKYQMTSTDGENWKIDNLTLVGGGVKFRANNAWGGAGFEWAGPFPTGTGTSTGDISAVAGTYNITLNTTTGVYNFEGGPAIAVVKLVGTATAAEGTTMVTGDGSVYKVTSTFTAGTLQFDIDGALFGGTTYPTGNADADTNFIPVPAGTYTVTFDLVTGDYSFAFPVISITGAGVGGWGVDTDLTTVDGVTYTINGLVIAASGDPASSAVKFRQDHAWTVSWGGSAWPTGTADGSDIPAVDGTYNVTFNIVTGAYDFGTLSTKGFSSANFKVYPNPTQNVWNFTSTNDRIESVKIVDVLGKNVMTVSPKSNNVSVDGSSLTKGIYFAKIATAKATETIKLMKN